jgi:hypothetical protein
LIGEGMAKETGKHFLNMSLVFLGGVFVQSALKEDWRIALVGLGFSVFFTCLGASILAKQKENFVISEYFYLSQSPRRSQSFFLIFVLSAVSVRDQMAYIGINPHITTWYVRWNNLEKTRSDPLSTSGRKKDGN